MSHAHRPVPSLESVDDHNARRRRERQEYEEARKRTGVACPKCGKELLWREEWVVTLVFPPPTTRLSECKDCQLLLRLES